MTSKKKRMTIQPVNGVNLSMDIPVNGDLYQNKDKFEYVLTSEDRLSSAIEEMRAAGIENTNVLYLTR